VSSSLEIDLACTECGRRLLCGFGRHTQKYFVSHPGSERCKFAGKTWDYCGSREEAIEAARNDKSHWKRVSAETLELVRRRIDLEVAANDRRQLQGATG
jgi:hypothetical protein